MFGNLWKKAKNAFNTIKETAKNWSQGAFLIPGWRYCGPGNPLDNGEPVNESDAACRQHDTDFANFAKYKDTMSKKEINDLVRESDKRLISNLKKHESDGIGNTIAQYGIKGKMLLEDLGLLSPYKFLTT